MTAYDQAQFALRALPHFSRDARGEWHLTPDVPWDVWELCDRLMEGGRSLGQVRELLRGVVVQAIQAMCAALSEEPADA